ncbi:MAG TPA: VTT domain-containing protein [Patescibacteria group bacterium]|nr:VTT domain-containing protein [Patescibacteria group bacterium]
MNVDTIIQSGGILAIATIIFAESGMMLGFFLPGDTLLLAAGVFAAQGKLSIGVCIAAISVAAILGDNTGYSIGRVMGPRLFKKKDGILFRHEYVERTEKFYEKYGSKTMLLSHFIPIVRSFAPFVAGVGKMSRVKFFIFDAIGDTVWAASITLLGYWFGSRIPNIDHYVLPTILIVMLLSFAPVIWHLFGDPVARRRFIAMLKRTPKDIDQK